MSFISDGASVLPAVKSDLRTPTGAVTEIKADDLNELRQAALDLRTQVIADNQAISNVVLGVPDASSALVTSTGGTTALPLSEVAAQHGLNVKAFGAVGDGITDDTAAIQAAANAAVASQSRIFFPAGTFVVTGLTVADSLVIEGVGPNSIIKVNTAGVGILFQPSGGALQSRRGKVSGLSFISGASSPAAVIRNNNFLNLEIENCRFSGLTATYAVDNYNGYGLHISKSEFSDITGNGVRLRDDGSSSYYSFSARISSSDFTRVSGDAIDIEGTSNALIDHVVIEGGTNGIVTNSNGGAGSVQSWNVTILGSYFESNSGYDIQLKTDGSSYWGAATVQGCRFTGTPTIDLGSKSKILIIGSTNPGGSVATVSGSANAEAYLLGSANFSQSGTFRWADLSAMILPDLTVPTATLSNGASNGVLIKDSGGTARSVLVVDSGNNVKLATGSGLGGVYSSVFLVVPNGASNGYRAYDSGSTVRDLIYLDAGNNLKISGTGINGIYLNTGLGGSLHPPTDAGAVQAGSVYQGSGAPNNSNGSNGDVYFRTDTPGSANQRIYVKSAGSWVGIL